MDRRFFVLCAATLMMASLSADAAGCFTFDEKQFQAAVDASKPVLVFGFPGSLPCSLVALAPGRYPPCAGSWVLQQHSFSGRGRPGSSAELTICAFS